MKPTASVLVCRGCNDVTPDDEITTSNRVG